MSKILEFVRRRLHRVAAAERSAAESERHRARIEAQWPEVHRLSTWAKNERERNHLTELFISTLGGKP